MNANVSKPLLAVAVYAAVLTLAACEKTPAPPPSPKVDQITPSQPANPARPSLPEAKDPADLKK